MYKKEHLSVDHFCWNKEYPEVHQWLDETYSKYASSNPYRHWLEHHHMKAISDKYGDYTPEYNAAYMHILFDFLSHHQIAFVPINEKDLESMLKSLQIL